MKEDVFRHWLLRRGHGEQTADSRVSSVRRVEKFIGDLGEQLKDGQKETLLAAFDYSSEDERQGRPNPSPVPIDGNLRTGLASLRQAIKLYDEFRANPDDVPDKPDQMAWLAKVSDVEIFKVMDDIDQEGMEEFLKRTGFSKPQQWTMRPEELHKTKGASLYPCKATIAAAIAKLPAGPILSSKQYFDGFGEAQSREKLHELGFEIIDMTTERKKLSRATIEAAMRAYEEHHDSGPQNSVFDSFGEPSHYWVRSTLLEKTTPYPTKPLVGFILEKTSLNGGWSPGSAAAALHNAGYIIVDLDGKLCDVPEQKHLASGRVRIRAVAKNYLIEPARDTGQTVVTINAREVADLLDLEDRFPNICGALEGREFMEMIGSTVPEVTMPNPSSTTAFTYHLIGPTSASEAAPANIADESGPMIPTNLILFGPPGTGKTYSTAEVAVRLCGETVPENRAETMETYNRLRAEKRIEFVTFHQSTSYEDFIEGRQPTTEGSEDGTDTGFRLETVSGVFRQIARRAEGAIYRSQREGEITLDNREVFKMSIGRASDSADDHLFETAIEESCILIGWEHIDFSDERFEDPAEILAACRAKGIREGEPNLQSGQVSQVNIFRNQVDIGDIIIVSKGNGKFRAIGEVTGGYEFMPSDRIRYSHRRSVRWLWISSEGHPTGEINEKKFSMSSIYRLSPNHLKKAALEHYLNDEKVDGSGIPLPFVLIIDEINRANISKVFGELITLIEQDKRVGAENALTVRLPYSGDEFGVPANLHILGTMNTADRSIALLDTALRRRFDFREMLPRPEKLGDAAKTCGLDLPQVLTVLNERIEYLYDREHQIGHAYFMGCKSRDDVDAVMRDKVIPLLAEYFFEDWGKVAAVLGDASTDDRPMRGGFMVRDVLRVPPGMEDGDGVTRYRWTLRTDQFEYSGLGGE
jgi:5-methylcytosine-specific restriction protein B